MIGELLAQVQQHPLGDPSSWGIIGLLIFVIIVCGVVAIAFVVVRAMGVNIPQWVMQCGLIVLAVIVGIFCIKLIASMLM